MSETSVPSSNQPESTDVHSALFAHLVMQHSSMAMTFMGKLAHPETGKPQVDIQAAKVFIDMLEMLEAKTKGNLSREEAGLLKQTLMTLRLTFVETVDSAGGKGAVAKDEQKTPTSGETSKMGSGDNPQAGSVPADEPEEENRKKFSKKY
jgi:hypothetical protein